MSIGSIIVKDYHYYTEHKFHNLQGKVCILNKRGLTMFLLGIR